MKKAILTVLMLPVLSWAADCHVPHDDWLAWQDNIKMKKMAASQEMSRKFINTPTYWQNCRKAKVMAYYGDFLQRQANYAFKVQDEKKFARVIQANEEFKGFQEEVKNRRNPPTIPLVRWK